MDEKAPLENLFYRLLFRKRDIAKYFLKKEPSELELAEEYKGIRNDKSPMAKKQRRRFQEISKKIEYEYPLDNPYPHKSSAS